MPATSDELSVARSWIGPSESDDDFNERFDRLVLPGEARHVTLTKSIEESLRSQLSALVLGQPASISVDGDSFNWTANIEAMRSQLEDFLNTGGIADPDEPVSVGPSVVQRVRPDYR